MTLQRDGAVACTTGGRTPWVYWALLASGLLLAVAVVVPNFMRTRVTIASNSCINYLRQIEGAKQQWALEEQKADSDVPTLDDIAPYFNGDARAATEMRCPQGAATDTFFSSYEIGPISEFPKCKIRPDAHALR